MKDLDPQTQRMFKEIMRHCRMERKAGRRGTVRELALQLGVTENFVSSVENGRAFPSLALFLKYLIVSGFDLEPLKRLRIKAGVADSEENRTKNELVSKIYKLDQDQVTFMVEQAKVAEIFKVKAKRARRS